MKKKVLKTMAIAVGMTFVFGTGVYAGSTLEQISAYLNKGVNLTWNGLPFYPVEEDGSRIYPITYNGRTYIPAKFIAEKAGINVGWNGNTNTVSFTDSNYVPVSDGKGTYRKIGNGTVKFLTDDFESIAEYGYDVEETLAVSQAGVHNIKMRKVAGTASEKKQAYIGYVENMKSIVTTKGWTLTSEVSLGNGHLKITAVYPGQPLKMELYSTDSEIIINASRTDMNGSSVTNNTISSYFDGYFSSVPKPNLDSSWREEVQNPLKDWTVGSKAAYTFSTQFYGARDKIDPKAEEYKNMLLNNGFKLYDVSSNHYTYTKGDIAVKIFAGSDNIYVSLSSGYQAPHM